MLNRLRRILSPSGRGDALPTTAVRESADSAACKEKADGFLKSGAIDDAARLYRSAIALDPRNARAHFALGYSLRELGEMASAVEHLAAALAIDPEMSDAHYVLGSIHLAEGRYDAAIGHLQKVVDLDSADGFVYRDLCLALLQSGKTGRAGAIIDQGIAQNPEDAGLHLLAGNLNVHVSRAEEAVRCFQRALALQPELAEAHYNCGLALRGLGRQAEALACFDSALQVRPEYRAALTARGKSLQDLGRPEEALACQALLTGLLPDSAQPHFDSADLLLTLDRPEKALASLERGLRLAPDDVNALVNRGDLLARLTRPAEALASYDEALALQPDTVAILCNRGGALFDLKRPAEALASFERAIAIDPSFADAHGNMGSALVALGRPQEALASFGRALEIRPNFVDALVNKGDLLRELQQPSDALALYDSALKIDPTRVDALSNRALALHDLDRFDEALAACDLAIRAKPGSAELLNNRGLALRSLRRFDEALLEFQHALQLKPDLAEAHANRGNVFTDLTRHHEALACYEAALAIRPDYADVHFYMSMSQLILGEYLSGWREYEWRGQSTWWAQVQKKTAAREFHKPLWLGRESLRGKTILLHHEQGLGDTIQFCRYAQIVKAKGATVWLEVQPALATLLHELVGVDQLFKSGEVPPGYDFHCPLMSLPHACGTDLASVPTPCAYLGTSEAHLAKTQTWVARLGARTKSRVGLVWSGNAIHRNDVNRSIPFTDFAQLISDQHQFHCLQTEIRSNEYGPVLATRDLSLHLAELTDFSETAGLIGALDLVICVDTSVAHLSAALGKPTWLLLPANPDWRWLLGRDDSPWYRSIRLFRQPAVGDWTGALSSVRQALDTFSRAS